MKNICKKYLEKKVNHSYLFIVTFFFCHTSQSEVTLDGSMGTASSLTGPDYQITESLGQRTGNNLFHSFGKFNLNQTESATFSGSAGIQNVISRVTGGQASTIDGALRSTIPGANVYFINPSGVIFGDNASLDVQGSFHASTANYLKFKDGIKFETRLANANPILTVANPEAFGFLNDSPAPITVSGGLNKVLKVPEGATLSLVAGDITINDTSLYAPSGQVVLASAGSAGEVIFNDSGIDTSSFSQGGNIHLSRLATNPIPTINDTMQIADIDVSADAAGKVIIRGGQMVMDNAYIWSDTTNGNGKGIDIGLKGNLTINGIAEKAGVEKTPQSGIIAYAQGKGSAGNIVLNVDGLKLTHGTRVDSTTTSKSSGHGGDILINANSILLEGNDSKAVPKLTTGTTGSGNAGNININNTDILQVNKGAFIRTYTSAKGNTGALSINTGSLDLHDGSKINSKVTKTAEGSSGNLTIKAGSIVLSDDSIIQNITNGQGNSGHLTIHTDALKVKNGSILNHTTGLGNSGNLTINTGSLELLNGRIGSESNFATKGQYGNIEIKANSIFLKGDSFETRATISNDYFGNKKTGNLKILTDKLELSDWAFISTHNYGVGNTGNLFVKANEIVMSSNTNKGASQISAILYSTGNSGDLTIESQNLIIRDGGEISIKNAGEGVSGVLSIEVNEDIILDGFSTIKIFGSESVESYSSISNNAFSSGQVKNTFISAKNILVKNKARIDSSTLASSNGSNVEIKADYFNLQDSYLFTTGAIQPDDRRLITGTAGDLKIDVSFLDMNNTSLIGAPTLGAENGGNIEINADNIALNNRSSIITGTDSTGKSGNLTINATNLLLNNAFISSSSVYTNFNNITDPEMAKAGDINITVNETIQLKNNSVISAQAQKAHAGSININGKALLYLNNESAITSSVRHGQGQGGNISIDNPIVVLNNSNIIANAIGDTAGNITIPGFLFESPNSLVIANSKLSTDGELNLKPENSMGGNLAVLPESLLNASSHLSHRCATRSEGNKNSFIIKKLGSVPLSPSRLSPVNFLDYLPTKTLSFAPNVRNIKTPLKNDNQFSFNSLPCIQQPF